MGKPWIVCLESVAADLARLEILLKQRFGASYRVVGHESATAALRVLPPQDARVALAVLGTSVSGSSPKSFLSKLRRRHPETRALLLEREANECSRPWADATVRFDLAHPRAFLETVEQMLQGPSPGTERGARPPVERTNERLKALHEIGLALAASFNIDSILSQTVEAIRHLVGEVVIDVFYAGFSGINATPRWLPRRPGGGNLSAEARDAIERRLREAAAAPSARICRGELLPREEERERFPILISHGEEILGLIVIRPSGPLDSEERDLLSLLSLQAATALRNIHLTQERLHVERLSAFGRMIGSLVHDFRSPLTAVRGYASMLRSPHLTEGTRTEYSRLSIEECDRLNAMIDELLEFTRRGRTEPRFQRIRLSELLLPIRQKLALEYREASVRFECDFDFDGDVYLDPTRMSRAITNVAVNACQSLRGKGRLLIRTRQEGERFRIEFEDDGCGIPEDIAHRIFEPFFSHGKTQGIGLGMSITKKIVEEHGGTVTIESVEGNGTTVRICLPVAPRSSLTTDSPDDTTAERAREAASTPSR